MICVNRTQEDRSDRLKSRWWTDVLDRKVLSSQSYPTPPPDHSQSTLPAPVRQHVYITCTHEDLFINYSTSEMSEAHKHPMFRGIGENIFLRALLHFWVNLPWLKLDGIAQVKFVEKSRYFPEGFQRVLGAFAVILGLKRVIFEKFSIKFRVLKLFEIFKISNLT